MKFKFSAISLFLKDRALKVSEYSNNTITVVELPTDKMPEIFRTYEEVVLDEKGTVLSWNGQLELLGGYMEEEILGQNINLLYLPLDRQSKLPEQLLEKAITTGTATHFGQLVKKDGSRFWGSIKITAVKKNKKELLGFVALCRKSNLNESDEAAKNL